MLQRLNNITFESMVACAIDRWQCLIAAPHNCIGSSLDSRRCKDIGIRFVAGKVGNVTAVFSHRFAD